MDEVSIYPKYEIRARM